MSNKELDRLSVLQDLKNNQIKTSQAAESMRVSIRHVYPKTEMNRAHQYSGN